MGDLLAEGHKVVLFFLKLNHHVFLKNITNYRIIANINNLFVKKNNQYWLF